MIANQIKHLKKKNIKTSMILAISLNLYKKKRIKFQKIYKYKIVT